MIRGVHKKTHKYAVPEVQLRVEQITNKQVNQYVTVRNIPALASLVMSFLAIYALLSITDVNGVNIKILLILTAFALLISSFTLLSRYKKVVSSDLIIERSDDKSDK